MPTPPDLSPTGVYLPRSNVWGSEEGAGAWVSSPGYDPSPGYPPSGAGWGMWYIEREERPRKARLLPSFRVIVGVPSHTSKPSKIRRHDARTVLVRCFRTDELLSPDRRGGGTGDISGM
jgi:hypothetical protein